MHALFRAHAAPAAVAALCLGTLGLTASPAAASGDPEDDVVRDLSISIDLDEDGVMHVQETYDWDFGEREGLGFFRTLSTELPTDEGRRLYDVDDFELSSPSGAPAEVADVEETSDGLRLSLGAPDDSEETRTGLQTYELRYTVHGAVDPASWEWITAGPDQDVPIERVTTEVTAPAEILDAACWQGADSDLDDGVACTAEVDGDTVTATATGLAPGGWQGVQVDVPAGTFSEATPIYAEPTALERLGDDLAPTTDRISQTLLDAWWAVSAAVVAAVAGLAALRRRSGRDEHFPGLVPGVLPEPGTTLETARLEHEPPPTARHTVPDDLRPYEAALLWRKSTLFLPADFTTLTLVDLAARGHLRLEETPGSDGDDSGPDWIVSATGAHGTGLAGWEQDLLAAVVAAGDGDPIRLSDLDGDFSSAAQKAQSKAVEAFDSRHLLARRLGGAGSLWGWAAAAMTLLLLILTIVGWATQLPTSLNLMLTGATAILILLGLTWMATSSRSNPRTALGRAHLEQLRGLRRGQAAVVDISPSPADTPEELTPEEITAQLPYAMALGDDERWAALADARSRRDPSSWERHQGLSTVSWVVLATSLQSTIGASHSSSGTGSGGAGSSGFSAGSFGGGGGVAGR